MLQGVCSDFAGTYSSTEVGERTALARVCTGYINENASCMISRSSVPPGIARRATMHGRIEGVKRSGQRASLLLADRADRAMLPAEDLSSAAMWIWLIAAATNLLHVQALLQVLNW